jgi:hypothetical protein
MDWIQTFTILIAIGGGFLYLLKEIQKVKEDLTHEIQKVRDEINEVKMEVLWIKFQLGYNPDKQHEIHGEDHKEN